MNEIAPTPEHDPVNTPAHYRGGMGLEAIDVIEAWGLGFHLGNAVKYILRAGGKGNRDEDLKKACRYLSRAAAATDIAVFPSTFVDDTGDLLPEKVGALFHLGWNAHYALHRIHRATRAEGGPKAERLLRDAKRALELEIGERVPDWELR